MKFVPQPRPTKAKKFHILVELGEERYAELKAAAAKSGVSMKGFARQALDFAMDNLG